MLGLVGVVVRSRGGRRERVEEVGVAVSVLVVVSGKDQSRREEGDARKAQRTTSDCPAKQL